MPKGTCDYLLPGQCGYIAGDSLEHPECLLAKDHAGERLVCFSDGKYFAWSPLDPRECDEEDCGDIGYCGCFVYTEVSPRNASERIKKEGPG